MHNKLSNKYYFINKFDTNDIDKQDKNTAIIYRNYKSDNSIQEILKFKKYCKYKNYNFYLSNNIKLAFNLNLDGAYIPSFNKSLKHLSYSFSKSSLFSLKVESNFIGFFAAKNMDAGFWFEELNYSLPENRRDSKFFRGSLLLYG